MTFNVLDWHSNGVGISCFDILNLILTFELSRKILFWHSKTYFDIFYESENPILIFKILFWHSQWIGKFYFDIQNPILTFALGRKILFWYSKSYFDTGTKSENPVLIFKNLFWHSLWVGISYFYIQKPILTFALSRNILFCHLKSYFDIRTQPENPILTFKILFWHSQWVGISYFDIQNPVLTFAMSQNILFWHSKSYFDFPTESEIVFWHSKSYFDIRFDWLGKSYFDIRRKSENPILTFKMQFDIRTESEIPILTFKILFWHSHWVGKSYFNWPSQWTTDVDWDFKSQYSFSPRLLWLHFFKMCIHRYIMMYPHFSLGLVLSYFFKMWKHRYIEMFPHF